MCAYIIKCLSDDTFWATVLSICKCQISQNENIHHELCACFLASHNTPQQGAPILCNHGAKFDLLMSHNAKNKLHTSIFYYVYSSWHYLQMKGNNVTHFFVCIVKAPAVQATNNTQVLRVA